MALRFDGPAPYPLIKWELIEATGWTLEYVDALDAEEIIEWLQVNRGRNLATKPKGRGK